MVLGFAQLVHSFARPELTPYIPVTDSRFADLARRPKGIIGISNPIAPSLFRDRAMLVRVGFPLSGFRFNLAKLYSGRANSRERGFAIVKNTEQLGCAIDESLLAMAATDRGRFQRGEMNVTVLHEKLSRRGVQTWSNRRDFVSKLIDTPMFHERYRRCLAAFAQKPAAA
jgi:hypothetical protein